MRSIKTRVHIREFRMSEGKKVKRKNESTSIFNYKVHIQAILTLVK